MHAVLLSVVALVAFHAGVSSQSLFPTAAAREAARQLHQASQRMESSVPSTQGLGRGRTINSGAVHSGRESSERGEGLSGTQTDSITWGTGDQRGSGSTGSIGGHVKETGKHSNVKKHDGLAERASLLDKVAAAAVLRTAPAPTESTLVIYVFSNTDPGALSCQPHS